MATRLAAVRRGRWALLALVAVAVLAGYWFVWRSDAVAPRLRSAVPTSRIGIGREAVAVAADGTPMPWLPLPEGADLPSLPISEPPASGRLRGPVLQQALVLGAAPAALRPLIERSYYGESGVDVVLDAGIEVRFGDASQAGRKWRAAAAVLADPSISRLDYVNVQAPAHPATGGSGHTLPAAP